ncbi:tetratricopeptide repeat protein [Duncaniella muricolitica]|uniref:tetratricopeptide repeat protein n=1 Tax=Duncaniella muricolitica TaxID=2880704 RepID=UPI00244E3A37|nr:tetratricopeptide repeat protein [Duncaniella muricolitica]
MMWHKILLLTFMTMIPSWILADTPYLDLVEKADKACADGKWIEAASLLQNAIDSEPANPGNVLLLSNLGMVRYNLGLDSLAIESFNRALSIAPSSVTILANRAKVYTAMGHEQEAFDDYGRIMQLDSTYITARYHHGLLALKHRMFDVAKTDFDYLTKHYPSSDEAFIAQATMHSSLGEYEESIPFYTEILRTMKEPEYYGARAYCYLMTGNLQDAADDIAAALELAPDDGELYLYRAALNKMHFRPDDARKDASKAIELGVDPARAKEFL